MLLVLFLEASATVRSIIEVSVTTLPCRQSIESSVYVFEKAENNGPLALEDLLFGPGELLAHLSRCLEHFHSLSYV